MNPETTTEGLTRSLQGALLLARGRPDGLALIRADLRGAARSFWAAAICLPAFLCLRLLDWTAGAQPMHPGHAMALDLLSYGVGWAGFAVLSRPMVQALGRLEHWPRFIAAWNWCNVIQYLLLVAAALPGLLGAPALIDEVAGLVALGWALWIEWFAIRLALEVDALPAAGLVGLDVAIGLVLAAAVGLLGGG